LYLINAARVRLWSCISSRITTVIQVEETIEYVVTDIMSHSQLRFIILMFEHAWLNL
jgi:hypothetical protein